jgi:hypothetical protein
VEECITFFFCKKRKGKGKKKKKKTWLYNKIGIGVEQKGKGEMVSLESLVLGTIKDGTYGERGTN